jgi:hypothetical protein
VNASICPVNYEFMVVGPAMLLGGVHDPNQTWLPFMAGTHFYGRAEADEPVEEYPPEKIKMKAEETYAVIDHRCRRLYPHWGHRDQMLLPFREERAITTKEWIQLSKVNHPGFETDDGGLIKIELNSKKTGNYYRFCNEQCWGRFFIRSKKIYFSDARDAVIFKMSMGSLDA